MATWDKLLLWNKFGKVLPYGLKRRLRYIWHAVDDGWQGVKLNREIRLTKNIYIVENLFDPPLRILFYPDRPEKFYTIYKIITLLGFRIIRDIKKHTI